MLLGLTLLVPLVPDRALAQGLRDTTIASLPSTDDKTGTNPLNLQQAVTVSNEFASLADALFVDAAVYSYAMPLARRRLSAEIELPLVTSNVTGRTEAGFGDLGARVVWIPWLAERIGLLSGVDTTWSTATNSALGLGRHTLTPFVQLILLPSSRTIVAPRYGQRVSAGGKGDRPDINEAALGVYTVWLPTPMTWIVVEPEVVFDLERDWTNGDVVFEYGRLLFGGVGTYIRPRVGLGHRGAKPFEWALEVGFRIIP